MIKKLLAVMALGMGLAFAVDLSVGIRIGPPPPPRVVAVRPVAPGPDFTWVEGYWYPMEGRYVWHDGYWTRPVYGGAHWVAPRHDGERYYSGYWDGAHGRVEHNHHTDRARQRDFHH